MNVAMAFDELPMPELSVEDLHPAKKLFQGIHAMDDQSLRMLKLVTSYQGRMLTPQGRERISAETSH